MLDLRKSWFDHYQNLGFSKMQSAPLAHPIFPLSFNMSAGLIQLDPKIRSSQKVKPQKGVLIQKCFRYFDLDKVGDPTHLSFFEMTGAFELIEYDRVKTINDLWSFYSDRLRIDPSTIWVTAFESDYIADKKIGLDSRILKFLSSLVGDRVVMGDSKTNLWKQGGGAVFSDNLRLCGPQVEFFYDSGARDCCKVDKHNPLNNCGRFIEIGNIIFIEYVIDCNKEPTLKKLVNPSTEAVIGLERVAQITEGVNDIYQTTFFKPLLETIGLNSESEDARIIIDHIKALVFILCEGKINPGKNGREKIVRKLIRQFFTSCIFLKLDVQKITPVLIDEIIKIYQDFYPEINNGKENALEVISDHYSAYSESLTRGLRRMKIYQQKNHISETDLTQKDFIKENFGVPIKLQQII